MYIGARTRTLPQVPLTDGSFGGSTGSQPSPRDDSNLSWVPYPCWDLSMIVGNCEFVFDLVVFFLTTLISMVADFFVCCFIFLLRVGKFIGK